MLELEELTDLVVKWADDRQILAHSTPAAQAVKTVEEANELLDAARMGQDFGWSSLAKAEYVDAVGDILVTLIIGCKMTGIDMVECLAAAYDQIKDRKGHLSPEGIFVKDLEQ